MGEFEEEIKVIFPHESGVGVTSMIDVLIGQPFNPYTLTTPNASFVYYFVEINNKKYCLHLWDSIGQEKYRSLTKINFRDSNIVIFVYDVTNMSTFKELEFWIRMIKELLGEDFIGGIMGTKYDLYLKQKVSDEKAESFAKSHGMKLRLVSSKNDPNSIKKFIEELCYDYLCFKKQKILMNDKLIMQKDDEKGKKERKKKEKKVNKENINIDERKMHQLYKLNTNYIKTINKYYNY